MKLFASLVTDFISCAGSLAVFQLLFQIPFDVYYLIATVFLFAIIEMCKRT